MERLIPGRPLTDWEGSGFWYSHFRIPTTFSAFPLLFDMVSEGFRDKRFAVMTLACLGLFFFYLAVFNKPESHLSCLTREGVKSAVDLYLNIDGVLFKVSYGVLAAVAMLGNIAQYSLWFALFDVLWVVWALVCFSYDLAKCHIADEIANTHSMRFFNFSAMLLAHCILALVGIAGVVKKSQSAPLSTNNCIDFPTPVRVNVAIILAIWIVANLFISTIQTIINLFRAVQDLKVNSSEDSWEMSICDFLSPLPYALLTGALVGLVTGCCAIFSLYRSYRRIIAHIMRKNGRCKWLRKAWKEGTHNSMFFIVQFVANSLYLYIIAVYIIASFAFLLYSKWFYQGIWNFLKIRPEWLPLFIIPFLVKWFYLPRLVDKVTNRIRNIDYFNFWFLVVSVFGVLIAFYRALSRMIMGIALLIGFGYRSDQSIFPAGRESLDSLYTSFCGMVIVHCLEAGIYPDCGSQSF